MVEPRGRVTMNSYVGRSLIGARLQCMKMFSMQTFPRRESEWPRAFPDLAAEESDAFQPRSVISFMTLD